MTDPSAMCKLAEEDEMNPFKYLKSAWEKTRGTVVFSRRYRDPKTDAFEVITYVAIPIPGTGNYDVAVTVTGFYGQSESKETWSEQKLAEVRERVADLIAHGA